MKLRSIAVVLLLAGLPLAATAQTSTTTAGAQGYAQSGSEAIVAPTYNQYTPSTQTIHNNTQAPDVIVSGANQCALPIGASTSILGVGVGLSATPVDQGCERRNNANALYALGYKAAAVSLMCQDASVRKAMGEVGASCDPQPAAVVAPVISPRAAFCASLSPSDAEDRPYISQCLTTP